jgi:hypothetical protein
MTTLTAPDIEALTLKIEQETRVKAPIDVTFAALLEELGPSSNTPDGTPMNMKIEPVPGGRWYRDLGDGNGHYWATVQSIKRHTLVEFCGPLFMSQPVSNNVIYRLSQDGDETVIKFVHTAFGPILEDHRKGVVRGWSHIHENVRKRAERPKS